MPSPVPPFSGRSNTASAKKPFFSWPSGGCGCIVLFPNNSAPLSILPLPLRSNASQAFPEFFAVHDTRSCMPVPERSNLTPCSRSVSENPLPPTSIMIGVCPLQHQLSIFLALVGHPVAGYSSKFAGPMHSPVGQTPLHGLPPQLWADADSGPAQTYKTQVTAGRTEQIKDQRIYAPHRDSVITR